MAWTWSAPQRGTVASAVVMSSSHRFLQRTAVMLGRGDAWRGLSIGFAAFLTLAGAAAPNISPAAMTALLFLSSAVIVFYATFAPSSTSRLVLHAVTPSAQSADVAAQSPSRACLEELLTSHNAASACDRAAFARLTAHMSHELRTPLNAILGFSEMMSNEVLGPLGSSCYAAYARDIHMSGINLLKSAEDALAITSLLTAPEHQQGSATANAATAAADAIAFHAQGFAARGITAGCTVDEDADVIAPPQAVRQLLINLMADAANRVEAGASLSIASRTNDESVELLISVAGRTASSIDSGDSFSMLLARTLGELSGATLSADLPVTTEAGEWHVAVRFMRTAQNDFFNA
ncbi:MAG: HAMP domain-containing sensor histidine kinase [Hyphomicrobium sp.]